jgi:hypothetical protein
MAGERHGHGMICVIRPLFPGKDPPVGIEFEAWWVSEQVWTLEKSLSCRGTTMCRSSSPCPWGTRGRSWLRHCVTSRKVAGSIPDGVIGIFHRHNPPGLTTALGLAQPLTEMSNEYQEYFLRGKSGRCVGLRLPSSFVLTVRPGILHSSVGIVARLRDMRSGVRFPTGAKYFSVLGSVEDRLWNPPSFMLSAYPVEGSKPT